MSYRIIKGGERTNGACERALQTECSSISIRNSKKQIKIFDESRVSNRNKPEFTEITAEILPKCHSFISAPALKQFTLPPTFQRNESHSFSSAEFTLASIAKFFIAN
jgi:hypothetical protein